MRGRVVAAVAVAAAEAVVAAAAVVVVVAGAAGVVAAVAVVVVVSIQHQFHSRVSIPFCQHPTCFLVPWWGFFVQCFVQYYFDQVE
jgi:hypothetical protein